MPHDRVSDTISRVAPNTINSVVEVLVATQGQALRLTSSYPNAHEKILETLNNIIRKKIGTPLIRSSSEAPYTQT